MEAAVEFYSHHGCLVVRDTESDGDVSDWDPEESLWYVDGGSVIFAVQPGVDGPVRCEVWDGLPDRVLPQQIFEARLRIEGELQVEDPAGVIDIRLRWLRGDKRLAVFADDAEFAARVQIVVTPR